MEMKAFWYLSLLIYLSNGRALTEPWFLVEIIGIRLIFSNLFSLHGRVSMGFLGVCRANYSVFCSSSP